MFGKKQTKEWKPQIEFDGRNFIRIRANDDKTLQYVDDLIDKGYVIVAGGGLDMSVIVLNKPITKLIKNEDES